MSETITKRNYWEANIADISPLSCKLSIIATKRIFYKHRGKYTGCRAFYKLVAEHFKNRNGRLADLKDYETS